MTSANSIARRSILLAVVAALMLYWTHRALRMQHFRHCNRDLLRVVMFDQSAICTNVTSVLRVIEMSCSQIVRHAVTYMIGLLGTISAAMVTTTTAGLFPRKQNA